MLLVFLVCVLLFGCALYFTVLFGVTYCEPLQNGGAVAPAQPLASEPLGFGQKHDATVDIPLDTMNVMKFYFLYISIA